MTKTARPFRVLTAILAAGAFLAPAAGFAKKPSPLNKPSHVTKPLAGKNAAAARKNAAARKKAAGKKAAARPKKVIRGKTAAKAAVLPTAVKAVQKPPPTPLETAIAKAKGGDEEGAYAAAKEVQDPTALTLVEWLLIRGGSIDRDYRRIVAFTERHPDWPSMPLLRRRAEAALLKSSPSPKAVFAFFSTQDPVSTEGRIAWAEAYLAQGDTMRAGELIRRVWRHDMLSAARETEILAAFGDMIQPDDHRERYANLLFDQETEAGLRAAERIGGDDLALARAWASHLKREKDAPQKLDAVPETMKRHPGFLLSLLQHLRREGRERLSDALIVLDYMPSDSRLLGAPDKWWEEREAITRQLLDMGDYAGAYKAASGPLPASPAARVEADFLAGWIALRFVQNADLARMHFKRLLYDVTTPVSKARAWYWLGRTAEALGETDEAQAHYAKAAEHGATFYGQIALNKIGRARIDLPPAPEPSETERAAFATHDAVRAARLLAEGGDRVLALSFVTALCDRFDKPTQLALLAELAASIGEPRHVMMIGKKATQKDHPLEVYAFPTAALPSYAPVGREIDPALVYAIARQESSFNPGAMSHVGARGLMQLMPATARMTAKAYKLAYSLEKLTSDPAFNLQLGSAHLAELLNNYRGSYIMSFAAYNAGPGRVREWVAKYGDPRTGVIEPVDWIELIPFEETRNYVQRVMENMQVYRARLKESAVLDIEADLKRGAPES